MSDVENFCLERDEEMRRRIYSNANTEMLSVLEQFGGSVVSARFKKVFSYYSIPKNTIFPLKIALLVKDLSEDEERLKFDQIEKAHYLDWCYKVLFYAHVIFDDLVDNSHTRYGKTCWHKRSDVGLSAVFDALLMDKAITYIVNKKFERDIIDILLEKLFNLSSGQTLNDMLSKVELDDFNRNMYDNMVFMQNSIFITMPIKLAMNFAGITDQKLVNQVQIITSKAELLFQIMNDHQDLYGDSQKIGKEESDIQQRKCTWFAVKCLEKANSAQRELFKQSYGSGDPERVAKIKELYIMLKVKEEYEKFKNDFCMEIEADISRIAQFKLQSILFAIYKKLATLNVDEISF